MHFGVMVLWHNLLNLYATTPIGWMLAADQRTDKGEKKADFVHRSLRQLEVARRGPISHVVKRRNNNGHKHTWNRGLDNFACTMLSRYTDEQDVHECRPLKPTGQHHETHHNA
uniref:Uncharacterized protein n=1 Tax=Anopheles maculatus TaxID=74869 RepID=A0A182T313_9DIPT